jgi:hypothetical protein
MDIYGGGGGGLYSRVKMAAVLLRQVDENLVCGLVLKKVVYPCIKHYFKMILHGITFIHIR